MIDQDKLEKSIAELEVCVEALEVQKEHIFDSIPGHKKALEGQIKELKKNVLMIQSLSKRIENKIQELVPQLAQQLDELVNKKVKEHAEITGKLVETNLQIIDEKSQRMFEKVGTTIQEHLNSSRSLVENYQQIAEIENQMTKKRMIRFFVGIAISSVIAVSCSVYASSYMIKSFPTRVMINSPENIHLHESEVRFQKTGSTKVRRTNQKK